MSFTEKIKELVSLSGPQYEKGNRRAKVIAICSQKGGVGKTTTAVNLGTGLTHFHQKKVLVVDLDPQGHVEKSVGSLIIEGSEFTPISRILTTKRSDILNAVIKTEMENFHITLGDKELISAESAISNRIGREFIVKEALATARTHYDYILFDCPPALGNLTLNALVASDYALLPCEMSALAFEGVSDVMDLIREIQERLNERLKVLGVLFTRVDGRNITMNDVVAENMKKFVNGGLLKSRITVNTDINKAQLDGKPIFLYAPSSSGAENYEALASEVMKRSASKYRRPVPNESENRSK